MSSRDQSTVSRVDHAIINKRSPVPAYSQLMDIIYGQIKNRELSPNDMVPSEIDLCRKYGISRTTVREALKRLTQDGMVYTIKGKGTFVAEPKLDQIMIKVPNFYEDMAARGLKPDVKVLDLKVLKATKLLSDKLMIPVNEEVFRIKRLFLADNKPYVLERKFIIVRDCEILTSYKKRDLLTIKDQSVFDLLAGKCHICNDHAHVSIEATTVRPDEAGYLDVPVNTVAFYVDLVAYKSDRTPCGWIASIYRGDLYRFRTKINSYTLSS